MREERQLSVCAAHCLQLSQETTILRCPLRSPTTGGTLRTRTFVSLPHTEGGT